MEVGYMDRVVSIVLVHILLAISVLVAAWRSGRIQFGEITMRDVVLSRWDVDGPDKAGGGVMKRWGFRILLAFRVACVLFFWFIVNDLIVLPATSSFCGIPAGETERKCYLLHGLARFTTFTTWSWLLLGVYFHLAVIATMVAMRTRPSSTRRGRAGSFPFLLWILYESVFSVSLLVCIVVEAVLVPSLKREIARTGGSSSTWNDENAGDELQSFSSEERLKAFYSRAVFSMHNVNVLMMLIELLMNRFRFNASHSAFVVLLLGIPYWLFSVYWFRLTGVYYYFFIDHRKPIAWIGVTATMIATQSFFFLGQALSSLLKAPRTAKPISNKKLS